MSDDVKNPSHYNRGKIEVWEYSRGNVEVWELNEDEKMDYYTVNAVKYIARAGFKDPSKEVEDLQKAIAFLERKIKVLNGTTDITGTANTTDTNKTLVTFGDFGSTLTANQRQFLQMKFDMSVFMLRTCIEEYEKNNKEHLKVACLKYFHATMIFTNLINVEENIQKAKGFQEELESLGIL